MRPASVGFHCPVCVREAAATRPRERRGSWLAGQARRWGTVTVTLVAINLAVAVATAVSAALAGGNPLQGFGSPLTDAFSFSPYDLDTGQWWRVVTSAFTHVSVVHVGLNMLSLLLFGSELERLMGRGRYLTVYLVSALGGAVSIALFGAYLGAVVGASAAIYGLLGAFAVVMVRQRQQLRGLLILLAINLFISFLPGVSLLGHLGGLVAGALTTAALLLRPRRLAVGGVAVVVLGMLVVLAAGLRVATG